LAEVLPAGRGTAQGLAPGFDGGFELEGKLAPSSGASGATTATLIEPLGVGGRDGRNGSECSPDGLPSASENAPVSSGGSERSSSIVTIGARRGGGGGTRASALRFVIAQPHSCSQLKATHSSSQPFFPTLSSQQAAPLPERKQSRHSVQPSRSASMQAWTTLQQEASRQSEQDWFDDMMEQFEPSPPPVLLDADAVDAPPDADDDAMPEDALLVDADDETLALLEGPLVSRAS